MIGRSLPEYIFIRTSIFGLRLIAPLSILYVIASYYTGRWLFNVWLGYYAFLEAGFYLFVYLPRSWRLQKEATHPLRLTPEERKVLFDRCFANTSNPSDHAIGWFFSSPVHDLRRENVIDWIVWALFSSSRDDQHKAWEEEIKGYVRTLEKLLGHQFQPGRNEEIKCMMVSLDRVDMLHRPLFWYMIVCIVDSYTSLYLLFHGYQHFTHSKWYTYFPPRPFNVFVKSSPHSQLSYWYRPHRSKTKHPIVFFHGIGIGLWTYISFFSDILKADPDVGILAVEDLSLCMRISPPPLRREELLDALTVVLDHHGIGKFVAVGHSYGTIVQAHIMRCRELAPRVAAWLLIDPIPFLLHQPSVAYNFVYRQPKTANEWQLWYFTSRDPDIARALARYFFWTENILFKEDLMGRRVGVVLSGCDQILDAKQLRVYLTDEDEPKSRWESKDGMLEVLWYPPLDHSQVFDAREDRRPMVAMISKFVRTYGLEVSHIPRVVHNVDAVHQKFS